MNSKEERINFIISNIKTIAVTRQMLILNGEMKREEVDHLITETARTEFERIDSMNSTELFMEMLAQMREDFGNGTREDI